MSVWKDGDPKNGRDPARIERLLAKLSQCWYRSPQLRLGQLISILGNETDPFNIEDDDMERAMETFIDTYGIK